jgi:Tat protein secretion system quality control protein TatD with DNase activity
VPANVRYTAAFLAELRGTDLARLEPILDANARTVYGLPQ